VGDSRTEGMAEYKRGSDSKVRVHSEGTERAEPEGAPVELSPRRVPMEAAFFDFSAVRVDADFALGVEGGGEAGFTDHPRALCGFNLVLPEVAVTGAWEESGQEKQGQKEG
jgi:hypothetical protein